MQTTSQNGRPLKRNVKNPRAHAAWVARKQEHNSARKNPQYIPPASAEGQA